MPVKAKAGSKLDQNAEGLEGQEIWMGNVSC